MLTSVKCVGALVAVALVVGAIPTAVQIRSGLGGAAPIRLDVNLVMVPVTVTDRRGATVNGLARDNFQVFEDKVARPIVSFSDQDAASSIGLVLDTSGSMKDRLTHAKVATRAFFRNANAEDEAFWIAVSTRPEVQSGFTGDFAALQNSIGLTRAAGRTAFVDSVYLAIERMRSARNPRKALVILSDGMDNHSRYTRRELMTLALEADVQIYTIGILDAPRTKKPIELQDERNGIFLLDELSAKTGGINFTVGSISDIDRVAAKIGAAIRSQYLIGYYPPETGHGGKWRKIQVKSNVPGVRLYARTGYFAPPDREN